MTYSTAKTAFITTSLLLILATTGFAQSGRLGGTEWKLVAANGMAFPAATASLAINADATSFTGTAGCNLMAGSMDVDGRRVDFSPAITTRRYCMLTRGNVADHVVTSALDDAVRFHENRDTLSLYDRRGRERLRFHRISGDDKGRGARLGGQKWMLESIKDRRTFAPITGAFINFDERKHSAGGDTSCNAFGGDYSTSGTRIRFSNIISTMRACVEDSKMSVDREMLGGLRAANRFEIRDSRLFLYRGQELLLTFRRETM